MGIIETVRIIIYNLKNTKIKTQCCTKSNRIIKIDKQNKVMQTKTLTDNNSSLIMPTTNIILSQEQLLQSQYLVNLPDDELKNILNSNDQNRINNYNYKEEMIKKKNEIDLKYLKELKKVYEKIKEKG